MQGPKSQIIIKNSIFKFVNISINNPPIRITIQIVLHHYTKQNQKNIKLYRIKTIINKKLTSN